jgi:hypothetical protein
MRFAVSLLAPRSYALTLLALTLPLSFPADRRSLTADSRLRSLARHLLPLPGLQPGSARRIVRDDEE